MSVVWFFLRVCGAALFVVAMFFAAQVSGEEVHLQQADGDRPIHHWNFYGDADSLAPVLSVQQNVAPKVTPTPQPWWTVGPGTPVPTVRQYLLDLPLAGGVRAKAFDTLGQGSGFSNRKQLATETPTATPSAPSATPTSSPTARKPQAPVLF